MPLIPTDHHLHIGALLFPRMDQCDFTGPFEVLARVPNSTFHTIWREKTPLRDMRGLILTPESTFEEAPPLDVLLIPGGLGQELLMDDEATLSFVRKQAAQAKLVFSVCTGALICGAAGILKGIKTTTHWTAFRLLKYFGAIPIDARVVVDGKHVSAAGVTAGFDGALRVVSILRGDQAAQEIQLYLQYAPEPPFDSGSPATAPLEVLRNVREAASPLFAARLETAQRTAGRLGIFIRNGS